MTKQEAKQREVNDDDNQKAAAERGKDQNDAKFTCCNRARHCQGLSKPSYNSFKGSTWSSARTLNQNITYFGDVVQQNGCVPRTARGNKTGVGG